MENPKAEIVNVGGKILLMTFWSSPEAAQRAISSRKTPGEIHYIAEGRYIIYDVVTGDYLDCLGTVSQVIVEALHQKKDW